MAPDTHATHPGRPLRGWHVLLMFCTGFAIIIAVNLTLAFSAVSTFPGKEVGNSYVASQKFEAERQAQDALGWSLEAGIARETLRIAFHDANGAAVRPVRLEAVLGRPTRADVDVALVLVPDGDGWSAAVPDNGRWLLKLTAESADGTAWRRRLVLTGTDR